MPVCKGFYRVFSPVVDYKHLRLSKRSASGVLWGLVGCEWQINYWFLTQVRHNELTHDVVPITDQLGSSDCISSPVRGSGPDLQNNQDQDFSGDEVASRQVRPTAKSHARKLAHLSRCTHLDLEDLSSLKRLIEAIELARPRKLLPRLTHLTLGRKLMGSLGMSSTVEDHPFLIALNDNLGPRHLCVWFHLGTREEYRDRHIDWLTRDDSADTEEVRNADLLEWYDTWDDHWRFQYTNGGKDTVEYLGRSWALDSLTCHNITVESIPAIYAPVQKIIYAREPLSTATGIQDDDVRGNNHKAINWRANDIADVLTLLGPPDDSRFEFVNAGQHLWPTDGLVMDQQEDDGGLEEVEDAVEEERKAHRRVENLAWGSVRNGGEELRSIIGHQVNFTAWDETDPCTCCGRK